MPLTTHCPRCAATFVVTPEQLQARDGLVRCGVCAAVFDARVDALDDTIPVLAPVVAAPVAASAVASDPAPVSATVVVPAPAPASAPIVAAPAVLRGRGERAEPVLGGVGAGVGIEGGAAAADHTDPRPAIVAIVANPTARIASHALARDAADDEFDGDDDDDASPGQHVKRALLTLVIVLALLALAGQALWVWRVNLAAAAPSLRPVLERLCQPLACTVGYARRIDRLVITASALQTEPARQGGDGTTRLRLAFTLHNRHDQPQHWPALMLELRDFSDTVVVRRAVVPAEYLPNEYLSRGVATQPLAAGAAVKLSVPLSVAGGKDVNGYQLHPFYP